MPYAKTQVVNGFIFRFSNAELSLIESEFMRGYRHMDFEPNETFLLLGGCCWLCCCREAAAPPHLWFLRRFLGSKSKLIYYNGSIRSSISRCLALSLKSDYYSVWRFPLNIRTQLPFFRRKSMRERSQIPSCRTCKSYSKDSSVCYYGKPQETCPILKLHSSQEQSRVVNHLPRPASHVRQSPSLKKRYPDRRPTNVKKHTNHHRR